MLPIVVNLQTRLSVQLEIQKSNRYPRYEKENTLRMFKALFEAIEEIKTDFVEVNNNV